MYNMSERKAMGQVGEQSVERGRERERGREGKEGVLEEGNFFKVLPVLSGEFQRVRGVTVINRWMNKEIDR